MKELRAPKGASDPVLGTLTLAGGQSLLDGESCHIEIHPALAGLRSSFAAGALDEPAAVFRRHPPLVEALRQTPVWITRSPRKRTYSIIGGLRPYLLLRELEPQDLSMSALVVPRRLTEEALTACLSNELFVSPLLLVLFNIDLDRPAGARRRQRGNITRTLIEALESPFKGGRPLREQLGLSRADLTALGLDVHYHRGQLQMRYEAPEGPSSLAAGQPASSEEIHPEARVPSAAPDQEEKQPTTPPDDGAAGEDPREEPQEPAVPSPLREPASLKLTPPPPRRNRQRATVPNKKQERKPTTPPDGGPWKGLPLFEWRER